MGAGTMSPGLSPEDPPKAESGDSLSRVWGPAKPIQGTPKAGSGDSQSRVP